MWWSDRFGWIFSFSAAYRSSSHPTRYFALGMEVPDDVTGGAASFWILDVWYIHKTSKQEDQEQGGAEANDPDGASHKGLHRSYKRPS